MPSNRREYMREYMRAKRAQDKARGRVKGGDATPVVDTSDTSTAFNVSRETPIAVVRLSPLVTREEVAAFKRAEYERVKPAFLAAPDDDCASCGHDRQTYHLNADGKCWAPAPHKRSRRCECPAFLDPAEPF